MAEIATYDPTTEYDVRLARVVEIAGMRLLPRHHHIIRGDFLARIVTQEGADVVARADPR